MSVGLMGGRSAASLGDLLLEIYQAVRGGQFRLAIMGVRALIEQAMVQKVGDQRIICQKPGCLSTGRIHFPIQRDALNDILDAGHATIHRAYEPKAKDIEASLGYYRRHHGCNLRSWRRSKRRWRSGVPARPKKP